MAGKIKSIKNFIAKHQLHVLRDVLIFVIITLAIHFIWRVWARQYNYAPATEFMYKLMGLMTTEVYRQSAWVISGLMDVVRVDDTMHFYFPNQCVMYVNSGCSGLKQILQFVILIMLFPGPWKKKLWFIPVGMVIMHLTNLIRVIGLAVIMNNYPQYWNFSHDYIFRVLFYVVIFLLWVFWVERIKATSLK